MRVIIILGVLLGLLGACGKNNVQSGEKVEMYLLSSFQMMPNQCKVDSSTAVLESLPLLTSDDIRIYDRSNYRYTLTSTAMGKIRRMAGRSPFAITVDKKVIYYGVYMPPILSSICIQSISMNESWDQANTIQMNILSGGTMVPVEVDDQRNNPILIATLRKQGKLK